MATEPPAHADTVYREPHSFLPSAGRSYRLGFPTEGLCLHPGCGQPADHPNHSESW